VIFMSLVLGASGASVNPLGKAIGMIDELKSKITKEGEAEAKAYAEFVEWCDDTAKNTGFEIKTAASKKETLEATIAKASGDIDAAATKVEDVAASIAAAESDLKDATAVRDEEASDFAASEAKLVETFDTLGRAIQVISKGGAAALAQVDATNVNNLVKSVGSIIDAAGLAVADKQKLVALVQDSSDSDDEESSAPAGDVYQSKSGNIVDVLEDMKDKADDQLATVRKAEDSAKHNFAMLKQSLEDQLAADKKDMAADKAAGAAAAETKATAEGELAETVKTLANGNKALETAQSSCMQTAADHEATVAARTEELKVIEEAKKILQESTSLAQTSAVDQSYSMLQVRSQLRTRADLKNSEVVTLIRKIGKEHRSEVLTQLASRIATVIRFGGGGDIFAKVKSLITDMIAKLKKEADADATEKAYCDEQMSETEAKKSDLEGDMETLSTKIDKATAKSAQLKEEVKEAQAELAALASEQSKMDKIRREENAAYMTAKAELEQGLAGVRRAMSVLRDYYGSAFLQQPSVPEHSKATGAGQSIISILEVCESDMAKDLTAEETAESDSASEYETITQENTLSKATLEQTVKYVTQEFIGLDKSIAELTTDRETSDSELGAVNEYYEKIRARCIAKPESYADRAKARKEEIDGLKQALTILEDTSFVQGGKRSLHTGFLAVHQ
jgi:hypothetical protein